MDIFDQIATGVRPPPPSASSNDTRQAQPSLEADRLGYALAKQVPAMEHGFTIHTAYGEIVIPPGWAADFIADQVRMALKVERLKLVEKAPA